jgi:hypothetical protein
MKLNPIAQAILGGVAAALVVAAPLVDDGVTASEIIAIVLAGLGGSGLTAVTPVARKRD